MLKDKNYKVQLVKHSDHFYTCLSCFNKFLTGVMGHPQHFVKLTQINLHDLPTSITLHRNLLGTQMLCEFCHKTPTPLYLGEKIKYERLYHQRIAPDLV